MALVSASCGENKSADSREQAPIMATQQPVARSSAAPAEADNPAPPRDAQFTIVCKVIPGPGHVERAKQIKEELIKSTGMKIWYVSHDEQQSTLYYGYYRAVDDPKLRADRDRIAKLQDNLGTRPFADALPDSINAPDPTAPPEFNLANAKGFWSLQLAAYQGPGRKEAAIEAVKEARKMGVEAYYHHGPNVSEICIGAWPEEALRKQEFDGGDGVDRTDQQRPLLVLGPGAEVPQAVKEQYSKNLIDKETGRQVQVLEQKIEILDPTLRAMMEKYPTHVLNGDEEFTQVRDPSGKIVNVPKHSMIVPIPRTTSVLHSEPGYTPGLIAPAQIPQRQGGQLRSVGP